MEMNYEIKVQWSAEDDAFIATVPAVPGCAADAQTPEEAVKEVQVALQGHLEARAAHGMDLPEDPEISQFRAAASLFNISEIAKRAEINKSTLRTKLQRRSAFTPEETQRLKSALSSQGVVFEAPASV